MSGKWSFPICARFDCVLSLAVHAVQADGIHIRLSCSRDHGACVQMFASTVVPWEAVEVRKCETCEAAATGVRPPVFACSSAAYSRANCGEHSALFDWAVSWGNLPSVIEAREALIRGHYPIPRLTFTDHILIFTVEAFQGGAGIRVGLACGAIPTRLAAWVTLAEGDVPTGRGVCWEAVWEAIPELRAYIRRLSDMEAL